jgi:hypothetical protein
LLLNKWLLALDFIALEGDLICERNSTPAHINHALAAINVIAVWAA